RIAAVNTSQGGCARTPACGYPPLTLQEIYGKVLGGKAVVVDGTMEIAPGVIIHPAHRAHTAGSQLLEVPTTIGKLVFGSDAYSSWEGIRDWMIANPQQTDTVQQFLAYEKCYKITGGYQNCVAGHEPGSYTDKYPLTKNSWVAINGGRMAEIALAPGDSSHKSRGFLGTPFDKGGQGGFEGHDIPGRPTLPGFFCLHLGYCSLTYSYSTGRLLMPRSGGASQPAILPGSTTRCIRLRTNALSLSLGS